MDWDDLRKELKSITPEQMALNDRLAEAVAKGWLTCQQAEWIACGEELTDDE